MHENTRRIKTMFMNELIAFRGECSKKSEEIKEQIQNDIVDMELIREKIFAKAERGGANEQ